MTQEAFGAVVKVTDLMLFEEEEEEEEEDGEANAADEAARSRVGEDVDILVRPSSPRPLDLRDDDEMWNQVRTHTRRRRGLLPHPRPLRHRRDDRPSAGVRGDQGAYRHGGGATRPRGRPCPRPRASRSRSLPGYTVEGRTYTTRAVSRVSPSASSWQMYTPALPLRGDARHPHVGGLDDPHQNAARAQLVLAAAIQAAAVGGGGGCTRRRWRGRPVERRELRSGQSLDAARVAVERRLDVEAAARTPTAGARHKTRGRSHGGREGSACDGLFFGSQIMHARLPRLGRELELERARETARTRASASKLSCRISFISVENSSGRPAHSSATEVRRFRSPMRRFLSSRPRARMQPRATAGRACRGR